MSTSITSTPTQDHWVYECGMWWDTRPMFEYVDVAGTSPYREYKELEYCDFLSTQDNITIFRKYDAMSKSDKQDCLFRCEITARRLTSVEAILKEIKKFKVNENINDVEDIDERLTEAKDALATSVDNLMLWLEQFE